MVDFELNIRSELVCDIDEIRKKNYVSPLNPLFRWGFHPPRLPPEAPTPRPQIFFDLIPLANCF